MSLLETVNAAARFALELCAVLALAYWGFSISDAIIVEWLLGLGSPLLFALTWGAFVAPRAPYRLDDPTRLALEVTAFTAAVLALATAGRPAVAAVLGVVIAANLALMTYLGQRGRGGI